MAQEPPPQPSPADADSGGPAGQFSDQDMEQVKRYGAALGGGPSSFDEEVERGLEKRQQAREANAAKMHQAQTSMGLGPSEMDQAQVKQQGALAQQAEVSGAQQAEQAQQTQAQQSPPAPPPAPSGPVGTVTPYPAQAHAVGGAGEPPPPDQQAPPPPPPAPGQ